MKHDDYRNMSERENEIISCFVLERDGRRCYICKRTFDELLEIRERESLVTGRIWYTKVYVLEHKNNDSHQRDGDDGQYCGNIGAACWSCNRRKEEGFVNVPTRRTIKQTTQEKQDFIDGLPALVNWLQSYLIQNEHICYKEMVFASKKVNGLSPVTNERNIETEIRTESEANKNGLFQTFPHNCGSRLCNHEHICLNNKKPTKLLEEEKHNLETQWKKEFGISKDEFEKSKSYRDQMWGSGKPYMTFDEYIIANGKLVHYDFHSS